MNRNEIILKVVRGDYLLGTDESRRPYLNAFELEDSDEQRKLWIDLHNEIAKTVVEETGLTQKEVSLIMLRAEQDFLLLNPSEIHRYFDSIDKNADLIKLYKLSLKEKT